MLYRNVGELDVVNQKFDMPANLKSFYQDSLDKSVRTKLLGILV